MQNNIEIPTETSFFRDLALFQTLQEQVLPQLMRQRRLQRQLTIWSAGCSTGQEVYSVAILIQEYFPALIEYWNLQVLATDISADVIDRARSGEYDDLEIQRRLPNRFLKRYFHRSDRGWRIHEDIRLMVQFYQADLHEAWTMIPGSIDLLLMRNVLIYFDLVSRELILDRIYQLLAPDGYLFLGASESAINLDRTFNPIYLNGVTAYQIHEPN